MSYYSRGEGSAALKADVDIEELRSVLLNADTQFAEDGTDTYGYSFTDNEICFWMMYGDFHEETILDFLNEITPYVSSGEMEFTGEDISHQKYRLNTNTGKWETLYGTVYYSDEEMISALMTRGYKVTPRSKNSNLYELEGVTGTISEIARMLGKSRKYVYNHVVGVNKLDAKDHRYTLNGVSGTVIEIAKQLNMTEKQVYAKLSYRPSKNKTHIYRLEFCEDVYEGTAVELASIVNHSVQYIYTHAERIR